MTVGELIEKLKQYDPEMPVIKELYDAEYSDYYYDAEIEVSDQLLVKHVNKGSGLIDWADHLYPLADRIWDTARHVVVTI